MTGNCKSSRSGDFRLRLRRRPTAAPAAALLAAAGAVEATHLRNARQCHDAKEQLPGAVTEDEIENAARKVSIICEY